MTAVFQPAGTLRNRTFIGLLIAQFLAAFNDQAIHASAMFFAINRKTLTEGTAISLMPILFFAPWAIFCTLAGYLADKFTKRSSLIFWKLAEIGITAVATLGFVIGSELNMPNLGVWIVLSTVFLMGMHSTFFVPAKYGCMPEILQPHLLSRGNGLLESLSFLATILGTVSGGILSQHFNGNEYVIGLVLFALAVIGAAASFMIQRMPAANPNRQFPKYIYLPLFQNLKKLIHHRPLTFALVGIAFFTFMLAFMRAAVYMLGESRIPRWDEAKTSELVGMTALGIGVGSPLAGWLSGKKVELGLVPIGGIGMVIILCFAAMLLGYGPGLVACIILIGFFTGFYLVPMFTLLQHRAPKEQKGEVVATSNFVNVVGAIAASLLFFVIVWLAHFTNFAPRVLHETHRLHRHGSSIALTGVAIDMHNRPQSVEFLVNGNTTKISTGVQADSAEPKVQIILSQKAQIRWNEFEEATRTGKPAPPVFVAVTSYKIPGVDTEHVTVRLDGEPVPDTFDNRELPRYLFIGAAGMTFGVLVLLWWLLPDILSRSLWVLRSFGKSRLQVHGIHHLPGQGGVVLVYRSDRPQNAEYLAVASDRKVNFISFADVNHLELAAAYLRRGDVIAVPFESNGRTAQAFLSELVPRVASVAPAVVPIYCGPDECNFGEPLLLTATQEQLGKTIDVAASEKME